LASCTSNTQNESASTSSQSLENFSGRTFEYKISNEINGLLINDIHIKPNFSETSTESTIYINKIESSLDDIKESQNSNVPLVMILDFNGNIIELNVIYSLAVNLNSDSFKFQVYGVIYDSEKNIKLAYFNKNYTAREYDDDDSKNNSINGAFFYTDRLSDINYQRMYSELQNNNSRISSAS
jgi:hypothetical protein